MQQERITVDKSLNQRLEINFAHTTTELSARQGPFRELTTAFNTRDFVPTDFAVEDFGAGEFESMDYAL